METAAAERHRSNGLTPNIPRRVESKDARQKENIQGTEPPETDRGDGADAKVLLECRMCHTIALQPLTLTEIAALQTMGIVGKPCQKCETDTPWRYAEGRGPSNQKAEPTGRSIEDRANRSTSSMKAIGRNHRRVFMQVAVGVRDAQGNLEVTKTDNTSQSGLCFTSEKTYVPGEMVMLVFPYDPKIEKTGMPARIVREQIIEGADRKIYGAVFEARKSPKPVVA